MKLFNLRLIVLILPCLLQWASAANYSNPLETSNGGDPNIVYESGWYYYMSTKGVNLQMKRSQTLDGLKNAEYRVVYDNDAETDRSRCCNVWAPEMHKIDGSYYIYYAAGPVACCDGQRSHVLKGGATPWDSFSYLGQIRQDWSIDGTVLSVNNKNYYVYSGHEEGENQVQSLFIAPMTSPAETGDRSLISKPDQSWELNGFGVNEGPFALYHGGKTWLTYSASYCGEASYSLALLTFNGGDPLQESSWAKSGPVFSSANGNYGTGHNSFFTSPDGTEIYNVYHSVTNSAGSCGPDRHANALIVTFNEDGSPDFGKAPEEGAELPAPSGE